MKMISASALALPLVLAKAENLRGVEATAVAGRALARQLEVKNKIVYEPKTCVVLSPPQLPAVLWLGSYRRSQ